MTGPASVRFAWLTPRGAGGVAVAEVTGPGADDAVAGLLRTPGGRAWRPHDSGVGRAALWVAGELLDQILVVRRPEGWELHLHGSRAVQLRLERELGPWHRPEMGPADRLLRDARCAAQIELALEQLAIDWGAHCAAVAALPPTERRAALARARQRAEVARAHVEPTRLVLCGAQNAGKSTLMNRLLLDDRVLTGPMAGLTRDPVAERVALSGYPYELVDTAGEGPEAGGVDRLAQRLGRRQRVGALRLLVVDGSRPLQPCDRALRVEPVLVVRSKADLPRAPWPADFDASLELSCLRPESAPIVRDGIGEALRRHRGLPPAGPVGGPAALDAAQWEAPGVRGGS